MLLIIDNGDSSTHSLTQYFNILGCAVFLVRYDAISITDIRQLDPIGIVLSSGPRAPNAERMCWDIVQNLGRSFPILGISLGHQVIAQVFGGVCVQTDAPMYGKTSTIFHDGSDLFWGLPNPYTVTRYHAFSVNPYTLPRSIRITAWTQKKDGSFDTVMGLSHKQCPISSVQFQPEALCTQHGHTLLSNFLKKTAHR